MNYYDALDLIRLLSLLGISASRKAEKLEDTSYDLDIPAWARLLEEDWECMGDYEP